MAQTNINIRIDEDLKKQFEAFCSDIGMTMTTAFCVFAKARSIFYLTRVYNFCIITRHGFHASHTAGQLFPLLSPKNLSGQL